MFGELKKWAGKAVQKIITAVIGVTVGASAGTAVSSYKPAVDFSNPQPIVVVYEGDNAIPSNAIPSNAIPSNAIPSNAIPSNAIPSNALPAEAIPSNAIPAEAIPSNAIPAEIASRGLKLQRPPDFGEKVCKNRCNENTKYTYYSSQPAPPVAQNAGEELAGPVVLDFWADAYSLSAGECTTLHWNALAAKQVTVGDIAVGNRGTKQVCPETTTAYGANAVGHDGTTIGKIISINVITEEQPKEESSSDQVNRCEVFSNISMSVVYLDWTSGTLLKYYFKMPGGVPGLEKEVPGDTGSWEYSSEVGSYKALSCHYEGYSERLYCVISLPSNYSNTINPMALYVNGCDVPIYSTQAAFLPEIVPGQASNSGGGGGSSGGSGGDPGTEYGGPAGSCSSSLDPTSCTVYGGTYITPFCVTSPCPSPFCACP
ncbi:MAG: hypothetical protein Kow002_13830 [Anaerolineales bacterium]